MWKVLQHSFQCRTICDQSERTVLIKITYNWHQNHMVASSTTCVFKRHHFHWMTITLQEIGVRVIRSTSSCVTISQRFSISFPGLELEHPVKYVQPVHVQETARCKPAIKAGQTMLHMLVRRVSHMFAKQELSQSSFVLAYSSWVIEKRQWGR